MKRFFSFVITVIIVISFTACNSKTYDVDYADIVSKHGQLRVEGADLVDKDGNPFQLRGMSTHGVQWFPQFINKSAIKELRDDWKTNVLRLAMYTGENSENSEIWKYVEDGVNICIELDMYVVVDWHILSERTPMKKKDEAIEFFQYFSKKYGDIPNIIYEICNEPNPPATWKDDIKPYAEEVIPIIRKNAPNAIVVLGTPFWSQHLYEPLYDDEPLEFDNLMYTLHFYAATHGDWLRKSLTRSYEAGLPVFVTEFGVCESNGSGKTDFKEAEKWLNLLDEHNISYINWSFANKNETSSVFKPGTNAEGGWTDDDYSKSGAWVRNYFRSRESELKT